jgi:anaerobic selenocysteine-containing dehydrogenase
VRKKSGEVDPRTSTEARELIAAEALKQAVPTKEMEVIEWEQALFRAAKRALQRSKVPTQRTQKLVKSLQRSSKFDPGMSAAVMHYCLRVPAFPRCIAVYRCLRSCHETALLGVKAGCSSCLVLSCSSCLKMLCAAVIVDDVQVPANPC